MTVVYKAGEQKLFTANEVLWAKQALIDAMIKSALINQTEGFVEMIPDGDRGEDITRATVNETLRGVPESAGEFLNDLIGDLQRELEKRLKQVRYGAAVTGLKYDLAGDVTDIEVDLSIVFVE
jgi:hypothetical protein